MIKFHKVTFYILAFPFINVKALDEIKVLQK